MMSIVATWKVIGMITGKDSGLSRLVVEDPYLSKEEPNV